MFHLLVRRIAEVEEAEVKQMTDQCAILQARFKKMYDLLSGIAEGKIPCGKATDKKIRENLNDIISELKKLNEEGKEILNKEVLRKKQKGILPFFK